ncbi:MAG TPA: nucleotide pyrophosphohydrolase [Candidatus Babeliales bacterium]|nr:nucleotide pyrophosphohydrolase [Candidatus Babeliales bacterium]
MEDTKVTVQVLKDAIKKVVDDRDWNRFHSPRNLSMAISVEASELMEKFLWLDDEQAREELQNNRQEIEDELADVVIAALSFCNNANINLASAVIKKIEEISKKYPVEKAKGRFVKYTKL